MKKHVLFIHGGGEGAYEEDKRMAENLRNVLGAAYDVRCPKMSDEESPKYGAWKKRSQKNLRIWTARRSSSGILWALRSC